MGDSEGCNKNEIREIPSLKNITNPKITNNKNANLTTKLFESKKSRIPKFPLPVEKELNELSIIYIN